MRKHSARKWLHAVLDLLPVVLIPVFMIFSHRHDPANSSSYTEDVAVYYETNEITSVNDIVIGNVYTYTDDYTQVNVGAETTICYIDVDVFKENFPNYYTYNILNARIYYVPNNTLRIVFIREVEGVNQQAVINISSTTFDFVPISINYEILEQTIYGHVTPCDTRYFKEYQTITYDFDKDIMGAFISNFNFTINKYFNMGNVFNLGDIYIWFNTNIFGGNAPTIMFSVWNIVLYEFVMDLVFLLYSLFMWFIDMCQKLMEKPLDSIK